jgi:ATP-dependent RNA helicase DeaD
LRKKATWSGRRPSKGKAKKAESAAAGTTTSDDADAHPEDLVEPEDSLPELALEELPEPLQKAAARAGWPQLTPVQSKAIPYLLAGRDLMVQSRTGSGKTGAFVLPILERIDTEDLRCQALVLVPTRELARQVVAHAETLFGTDRLQPVAVYGGVDYGPQIEAFRRGAPLVVGTPGRILDHLLKGALSLEGLKILVFDEADRMLSMGFYPDMKRLQEFLPSHHVNGQMFSATYPSRVLRLAGQFLDTPEFLSLSQDHVHVAATEHVFYDVPAMKKDRNLVRIIEIENPTSALIFCNTKANVHYVSVVLRRFGYDADELSSDLSQNAREKVLGRVRRGKLRFLVATDVAARGIDISELSHVIQYEPPEDPEAYIHRVGRTGRAGATGVAITLVSGIERIELNHIAKRFGIDMDERTPPTPEEVEEIVTERVTTLLEAKLRERDRLQKERMQRFMPLARELGQTEDEVAIVAMLLDDYYQESLHAGPEEPGTNEAARHTDKSQGSGRSRQSSNGSSRRRKRRRGQRGGR